MKADNQHLEFLISQYVDGCLEGAGKKSVEQQLLNNPAARTIYTQQREVQDLLDDWGSRIPLIHWDEFDQKLAARLEQEAAQGARASAMRRWLRPVAAAAALILAVGVGYGWHAMSHGGAGGAGTGQIGAVAVQSASPAAARSSVQIPELATRVEPSVQGIVIEEAGAMAAGGTVDPSLAVLSAPIEATAVESLKETVAIGMQNLEQVAGPERSASGAGAGANAVAVSGVPTTRKSEKDLDVNFP